VRRRRIVTHSRLPCFPPVASPRARRPARLRALLSAPHPQRHRRSRRPLAVTMMAPRLCRHSCSLARPRMPRSTPPPMERSSQARARVREPCTCSRAFECQCATGAPCQELRETLHDRSGGPFLQRYRTQALGRVRQQDQQVLRRSVVAVSHLPCRLEHVFPCRARRRPWRCGSRVAPHRRRHRSRRARQRPSRTPAAWSAGA
jgi:hypothetical protein